MKATGSGAKGMASADGSGPSSPAPRADEGGSGSKRGKAEQQPGSGSGKKAKVARIDNLCKEILEEWEGIKALFEEGRIDEDPGKEKEKELITPEALGKHVGKWKKKKAALTAQKRFDDVTDVQEVIGKCDILETLLSQRDAARKGDDLNACLRFSETYDKVQQWGWTVPAVLQELKALAGAYVQKDCGNFSQALKTLRACTEDEEKQQELWEQNLRHAVTHEKQK